MLATLSLVACALATAQAAPSTEPTDWQTGPRLVRSQELVFRGGYTEEAKSQGVQFNRTYRLESRVFVLDAGQKGAEAAFLTVWKGKQAATPAPVALETSSARLDLGRIEPMGRVTSMTGAGFAVPFDGPPIVECGAFLEVPRFKPGPDQMWQSVEPGRPNRTWQVLGSETINGIRCVKLQGVQQSPDWERPRADSTAWRRTDLLWISPRAGFAHKVERTVERREPARREPTHKSVLRYELESSLQYPGQLYEDRKREITQAQAFAESVNNLLPRAGQVGPKAFEAIVKRIEYHTNNYPPTPYREAVRHVQRLAEAGKRGDVPPEMPNGAAPLTAVQTLELNKIAPDFLALNLVTKESVRMKQWAGKPMVLVFYNPAAGSATDVLRFAQGLVDEHGARANVLGLAVTDDHALALQQRDDLEVKFPILSGTGVRITYKVDSTPKIVILDSAGIMRGGYLGWGPEIPEGVRLDLSRCLAMPR